MQAISVRLNFSEEYGALARSKRFAQIGHMKPGCGELSRTVTKCACTELHTASAASHQFPDRLRTDGHRRACIVRAERADFREFRICDKAQRIVSE